MLESKPTIGNVTVVATTLVVGFVGMLALMPPHQTEASFSTSAHPTLLTTAVWHGQSAQPTRQASPVPFVKIDVDLSPTQPADQEALCRTLAGGVALPGADALDKGNPPPDWFVWARLNSANAPAQLTLGQAAQSELPAEGLGIYATRNEYGATLCLVNRTDTPIQTSAGIRLPRGIYRIELLTYTRSADPISTPKQETSAPILIASHLPTPTTLADQGTVLNSGSAEIVERLERLEGADLGGATTLRKPVRLAPGEVCFYRCTDMARTARAAWYEVFNQLRTMGKSSPGAMHRLSKMLHEADGDLSSLNGRGGRGEGVMGRVSDIHHLLLYTAQAHSLHQNYLMRRNINEEQGKAVMAAFDHLTDSLSETSAVLLGLVPQVTVSASTSTTQVSKVSSSSSVSPISSVSFTGRSLNGIENGRSTKKREEKRVALLNSRRSSRIEPDRTERTVTILLANTGGHSVENVKLGLNLAKLPREVTCTPADPAYFGTLRPGQTVRATYRLRGSALDEMPNSLLTGDVSYFAGTAPAHLRPCAR